MRPRRRYILFILLAFSGSQLSAQYFSNGQDPFATRWREHADGRYRLIYPEQNGIDARRVSAVLDTAFSALQFGFSRPAMRLPIILHTQNLRSNGMVVWAPRRSELITAPPTETFATPWLKQLAIHEYRHVVQMSNLNRGVIRAAGWLLGEQALGASAILVPKWFLEGDAVLAETAMAAYGRALQPGFTLAYRALLADAGTDQFSIDKWFCGSYRDYLPDHYHYGYQMVNAGYERYGIRMWDRVLEFIARRPYMVVPRQIALRKYFGTSSGMLFRQTFGELKALWDALPPVRETMRIVTAPTGPHTVYSHPVMVSGRIIAHKTDFTHRDRIVSVDPHTSAEQVLAHTGPLSSRPVVAGSGLYWTEYRPDTFWEQKSRSVVWRMPLHGPGRARPVALPGNLFYLTPHADGFAAVDYHPVQKYAVVLFDADLRQIGHIPVPDELSVHGMAWDGPTNTLALITLGERGMALTGVQTVTGGFYAITEPSAVAINHLSAGGGKLFFSSTASGRDESHSFDLAEGREYRLSSSQFGSVMPSVDPSGRMIVQATYRRQGYLLSIQDLDQDAPQAVPPRSEPVDLFNLPVAGLGVPNLDTMTLYPAADTREQPSGRYRRMGHLFNPHSWAPTSFDAWEAANDRNLDLTLGATILSQSELSDTEGFLSYGRMGGAGWWRGGLRLLAMAPKFEFAAEYGGGQRGIVRPAQELLLPEGWDGDYFSVGGRVYLPVNLSGGAMLRRLTPSVSLTHYNTMFYRAGSKDFLKGYQRSEVSLSYAQTVRMAVRDLAPRWGFGAQAAWAAAPFNSGFGSLWSFYGNVYLPGLAQNHSLRLRGAYQTQQAASWQFGSNVLFPRGIAYNFAPKELGALLADYRFPLAYPDRGINGVLYIKRLSVDLFAGYARYIPFAAKPAGWQTACSWGTELAIDFNLLRMVGVGFTLKAALYRTDGHNPLNASIGLAVGL